MMAEYRKAIAAGIASIVLLWLTKNGITPETTVGDAVETAAGGGVAAFFTWLLPNG